MTTALEYFCINEWLKTLEHHSHMQLFNVLFQKHDHRYGGGVFSPILQAT